MSAIDFHDLKAAVGYLSVEDIVDVRRAFDLASEAHARQKRATGEPYVMHVIAVAKILAGWKADRDALIAALLHDALEDTPVTKDRIQREFGKHVATLVEGVTKFTQADLAGDAKLDRKIETLRRLFDVMRYDLRSAVIKLADRMHNVQTIEMLPSLERQVRFGKETLDVYYKIAMHLGMREARRVFADNCVPIVFGQTGQAHAGLREDLCRQGEPILRRMEHDIQHEQKQQPGFQMSLQPRNLLVFHERMVQRKGEPTFPDAFSIIVIVADDSRCYQMLKTLHGLYHPVSGQFKDYIASPTESGYQSLHTHVVLPGGATVKVRIRTPAMHAQAEEGITCHLFGHDSHVKQRFSWLKRSANLDSRTRDSSQAFWEALESDILRETIVVMVDRQRIVLPIGATALDAAYALYDKKANATDSITIGGQPSALSRVLSEDDDVHISFSTREHVTFDWLKAATTTHARLLVVNVLKRREKSEKVTLGAALLQRELDTFKRGLAQNITRSQQQHIADHFHRDNFEDVLAMMGEGVIRPRDVVFYLYPEYRRRPSIFTLFRRNDYAFRLVISATPDKNQDVLSILTGLIRMSDVVITTTKVRLDESSGTYEIALGGHAADRLRFADFVELLSRQEWISSVITLIPRKEKAMLVGMFVAAFLVIPVDVILLPFYQPFLSRLPVIPMFILEAFPLIPILIANYYLLRLLRQYVVRMRSDRWFLGVGFLLNIIGLMLIVARIGFWHQSTHTLLPLIVLFMLSLVHTGYRFFQTEALFSVIDERSTRPLSRAEWHSLKRSKVAGYVIRLFAVAIWGLEPIYIRYTPVNSLSPFLRTFLLGIGVFALSGIIYLTRHLWRGIPFKAFKIPYDRYFLLLVLGQVGYMYFKNASLLYTSGTNLLLFNNFSPLLGLLIAAIFWRKQIPYFRRPRTMLAIFLLAVLAGLGSSMLVYGNILSGTSTIAGDVLAIVSTGFDVLLTIGQIEYLKRWSHTDPALFNLHIFFFLLLFIAPIILAMFALGAPIFAGLTYTTLLLGMGIGLFVGTGQMLNYEAFKRIDGYLAYMMFNLSILLTFTIEAFVVHSVQPTSLLLISGALIIGSSLSAELVHSQCQKKGL